LWNKREYNIINLFLVKNCSTSRLLSLHHICVSQVHLRDVFSSVEILAKAKRQHRKQKEFQQQQQDLRQEQGHEGAKQQQLGSEQGAALNLKLKLDAAALTQWAHAASPALWAVEACRGACLEACQKKGQGFSPSAAPLPLPHPLESLLESRMWRGGGNDLIDSCGDMGEAAAATASAATTSTATATATAEQGKKEGGHAGGGAWPKGRARMINDGKMRADSQLPSRSLPGVLDGPVSSPSVTATSLRFELAGMGLV
jgi:hypothetical protein